MAEKDSSTILDTFYAVLQELNERKERQSIVIVHGLDEASFQMKEAKDRMAADLTKLQSLIEQVHVKRRSLENLTFSLLGPIA